MGAKQNLSMDNFVAIAKALSDTNRVRAILALRKGELCVCQIIELLGLAPSTISKHMTILKQAGLVESRKEGRWVYYRTAERKNSSLAQGMTKLMLSVLAQDEQVQSDDTRLNEITAEGLDALCKRQRHAGEA